MGIDIYLGGYDAFAERTRAEQEAFDAAVKRRDAHLRDSDAARREQVAVDAACESKYAGSKGYIRSSYNGSGLFRVLDRIFGTDSANLLFPGDWEAPLLLDWDEFIAVVKRMQQAARALRHGDPLPVRFDELSAEPNPVRQSGEAFGNLVLETLQQVADFDSIDAGAEQHGFYNEDDYGWYVHEGLDELLAFGELGKRLGQTVEISY